MAKNQHGAANVFNISEPKRYRCQIHHYHSRLSRLYLSVYQGQEKRPAFYLLFSDVGYIEGPVSWNGADFGIASKEDCIDLMLQSGLIGEAVRQFPDAYAPITDSARLYQVNLPKSSVRIIASSASLLQSIPADLG